MKKKFILVLALGASLVLGSCGQKNTQDYGSFSDYQDELDRRAHKIIGEKLDIDLSQESLRAYGDEISQGNENGALDEIIAILGEDTYYRSIVPIYIKAEAGEKATALLDDLDQDQLDEAIERHKDLLEAFSHGDRELEEAFMKSFLTAKAYRKLELEAYYDSLQAMAQEKNLRVLEEVDFEADPEVLDRYLEDELLENLFGQGS